MPHAPDSPTPDYQPPESASDGSPAPRTELGAKISRSAIVGAIFLMATSAIGPGFITQTATFTAQMGTAFAFAILASILIDIAIQLNIWRMITSSGKRAAQLASAAIPGTGIILSILIVIGGLAFNIGNIAGGGLGLNALLGIDPKLGGLVTGVLAIGIFLFKRAGKVVDAVVLILGIGMIVLTCIVAIVSSPPVGEAIKQSFVPDTINFATVTTIVGGTVGGYITYSGAHRSRASSSPASCAMCCSWPSSASSPPESPSISNRPSRTPPARPSPPCSATPACASSVQSSGRRH
jgi:Mn2+/Fe2+ NRAMP family transporter